MTDPILIAKINKNSKEAVHVAVSEYRQANYIDLRVYGDYDGAGAKPTRKGVALKLAELPKLRAALADAEAEARRLGLLNTALPLPQESSR